MTEYVPLVQEPYEERSRSPVSAGGKVMFSVTAGYVLRCRLATGGVTFSSAGTTRDLGTGAVMVNSTLVLLSKPSGPACLPSLTWTSTRLVPAWSAVQLQEFSAIQSVAGVSFTRNLYDNGSFSGSEASAVQVMVDPVSCGLAWSGVRLVTVGV